MLHTSNRSITDKFSSSVNREDHPGMYLVTAKVIAGLVMLAVSILVLIVPIKIMMRTKLIPKMSSVVQKRWVVGLQCLRCFSAGTLLGISYLRLIPDSRQILIGTLNVGVESGRQEFPICELLIVGGVLLCLYIEKTIWLASDKRSSNRRRLSITGSYDFFDAAVRNEKEGADESVVYRKRSESCASVNRISGINDESIFAERKESDSDDYAVVVKPTPETVAMVNGDIKPLGFHPSTVDSVPGLERRTPSRHSLVGFDDCDNDEVIVHETPTLKAVLISSCLTFYGFFDGLAVGVQRSDVSAWIILVSVALHRCFVSFVLGLEYQRLDSNSIHILIASVLFIFFPIVGLTGGSVLELYSKDYGLLRMLGIVQSVTTGALLYTGSFVIIYNEVKQNSDFIPLSCTLAGFGGSAVIIGLFLY